MKAAPARPTPTMRRPADQPSTAVIRAVPGRNGPTAAATTRTAPGRRRRSRVSASTVREPASIRGPEPPSSSSMPRPSRATIPARARSPASIRRVHGSGPLSHCQPARVFAFTSTPPTLDTGPSCRPPSFVAPPSTKVGTRPSLRLVPGSASCERAKARRQDLDGSGCRRFRCANEILHAAGRLSGSTARPRDPGVHRGVPARSVNAPVSVRQNGPRETANAKRPPPLSR